jgi:predicted transcriptional regulator
LTSASLPSLVPPRPANDELEELRTQLLDEKHKSEKIAREKKELESELENLSQALFEEVRDFPDLFSLSSLC